MQIPFSNIAGLPLHGTDETVGLIDDLLIEPGPWKVHHLVVDTGTWLPGHKVLLPPLVVGRRDWRNGYGEVELTRELVRNSPDIDTAKPVSRQMKTKLFKQFNVPAYWGPVGSALAGSDSAIPLSAHTTDSNRTGNIESGPRDDEQTPAKIPISELRSVNEMIGYYIRARDGDIGHVEDLIVDDCAWTIPHIVIDTKNWWPGRKVLTPPQNVVAVSWSDATIELSISRDEVKQLPEN